MSLQGNIAVEAELDRILDYMSKISNKPIEKQLILLRKKIEETRETAKKGWL